MPNSCESSDQIRPISRFRRILHWITALLVVAVLVIGLKMTDMDLSSPAAVADAMWHYSLHKTLGVAIFLLTIVRLFSMWVGQGFSHSHQGALETFAARAVQSLFLISLVLLPLTGLIINFYAGSSAPIFGIDAKWMHSEVPDPGQVDGMVGVHHFLAWGIVLALALHVAGALKHHFIDRDDSLRRMLGLTARASTDANASHGQSVIRLARAGRWVGLAGALALAVTGAVLHEHDGESTVSAVALDATGDFVSVADESTLTITAEQAGDAFSAVFERFQVTVQEGSNDSPAAIAVTIDSASFVSGLGSRDEVVVGSDWLDATAYPVSRYTTTVIEPIGAGKYQFKGEGELTIRDVVAPVSIDFDWRRVDGHQARRHLLGRAVFDRMTVDLGRGEFGGEDAAGHQINVEFDIVVVSKDTTGNNNSQDSTRVTTQ